MPIGVEKHEIDANAIKSGKMQWKNRKMAQSCAEPPCCQEFIDMTQTSRSGAGSCFRPSNNRPWSCLRGAFYPDLAQARAFCFSATGLQAVGVCLMRHFQHNTCSFWKRSAILICTALPKELIYMAQTSKSGASSCCRSSKLVSERLAVPKQVLVLARYG